MFGCLLAAFINHREYITHGIVESLPLALKVPEENRTEWQGGSFEHFKVLLGDICSLKVYTIRKAIKVYRFVEHASLAVFILSAGAIDETVTKHVIVDTSVAANYIRCWARETFHSVLCRWALCLN